MSDDFPWGAPTASYQIEAARAINKEYADLVTGFARDVVHQAFRPVPGLERVAISLVHPTLGHAYQGSVLVDRATWEWIIHGNVSAENAFRNFDLRFRPTRDFELQEMTPIRCPGGSAAADNALQPRGPGPTRLRGTVRSASLSLLSPVRLRVV